MTIEVALAAGSPSKFFVSLPALPSAVRYYDDFLDSYHSIRDLSNNDSWEIIHDGKKGKLRFHQYDQETKNILKIIFSDLLVSLDASSVLFYGDLIGGPIFKLDNQLVRFAASCKPHELREHWVGTLGPKLSAPQAAALRNVLQSMCDLGIGHWNSHLSEYVSQLPGPKQDPFRVVRTGDCFVPLDQQALVIDHFDELVGRVSVDEPDTEELRDACVLIIVFQYAFRPGQVARVKTADLRVFNTGAVHFAAIMTKKRDPNQRRLVSLALGAYSDPVISSASKHDDPQALFVLTGILSWRWSR